MCTDYKKYLINPCLFLLLSHITKHKQILERERGHTRTHTQSKYFNFFEVLCSTDHSDVPTVVQIQLQQYRVKGLWPCVCTQKLNLVKSIKPMFIPKGKEDVTQFNVRTMNVNQRLSIWYTYYLHLCPYSLTPCRVCLLYTSRCV